MAEVVGLVASVIQVASTGLRLSRTLRDYGSSVQGYEKRLRGLDKDIYFTSSIISELATLLKDPRVQSVVSERSIELTREIVAEFEAMFQAIENVVEEIRADSLGKWKIYFRESRIRLLVSNLDRLKGNLQLLIGVITHASQISTEHPDDATILAHRIKILELMVEKEEYTERYLREKRKYDSLMVQINSNSTLGSVSTIQTDNGVAVTWRSLVDKQFPPKEDPISDEHLESGVKGKEAAVPEPSSTRLGVLDQNESQGSEDERRADNVAHLRSELIQLRGYMGGTSSETAHLGSSSRNPNTREGHVPEKLDMQEQKKDDAPSTPGSMTVATSYPETFPPPMRAIDKVTKPDKSRKRERASRSGKKILKGTGYGIVGIAAVLTFPISLPLWWWYKHRRWKASAPYWDTLEFVDDHPHPYLPAEDHPHGPRFGSPYDLSYSPGHIPGELFDNDLGERAELELIDRLTIKRRHDNRERDSSIPES